MLTESILPLPPRFTEYLSVYCSLAAAAIQSGKHHDQRRALLIDFLRKAFGIEVDEIELEHKIKAASARGMIDAFYRYVIFEVKTDFERERDDAKRELTKYFESRDNPTDYVAAVTDGLTFEVYDYDSKRKEPQIVRTFVLESDSPASAFIELDELLAAGRKIPPMSGEVVIRFGSGSLTFTRSRQALRAAFESVRSIPSVEVKFREWNALLAKVYGSSPEDEDLFIKHTYLTLLSRAIVTTAIFHQARRDNGLYLGLLNGDFFRERSIQNLAEPDFFSWGLETLAETAFYDLFANLFRRLEGFDWSQIDEDLLKMLYQELVDPEDRQLLGEFYTPDWLAELMLERINYKRGTLLDTACGSGTFLFCAIRRLRSMGKTGTELVREALNSITGIDVHPVAVLMAKANILLALAGELREYPDDVYLHIYLADTLMTGEDAKKRRLAVGAGEEGTFSIPLDSIERGRDLDKLVDQMTLFARRGAASKAAEKRALEGFAKLLDGYTADEIFHWRHNFALLVKIMGRKRDTVWGFILKNAYRPAYLRRQKVDVIVANPPWLSLRDIQDPVYKTRLKELAFGYKLLEKTDRNLFTQLDTSTVFFAHSEKEFLKDDGIMAFVMPKAVILPAKQHLAFQKTGFTEIHDFGGVRGLFKVPTCVLFRGSETSEKEIPLTNWTGELRPEQRNVQWSQAQNVLKSEAGKWSFLQVPEEKSPYFSSVLQGATLVPRCLWFVEPPPEQPVNFKTPFLRTPNSIVTSAKNPWKVKLKGKVETKFLFGTALAEDLLPFAVRGLRLIVLPILARDSKTVVLDDQEILAEGAPYASEWVRKAENIWESRKKDGQPSVYEYLNYDQKLTNQNATERFVVLYNRSGTNISAAYIGRDEGKKIGKLPIQGFVADFASYRYYADSEDHALYLTGILNSSVVNEAIKPFQTQGLQGERDITRRPFEACPIPLFDPKGQLHMEIVKVARIAREKMVKWRPKIGGNAAQARQAARKIVAAELRQIDALVAKLLDGHKPPPRHPKRRAGMTANMFIPQSGSG